MDLKALLNKEQYEGAVTLEGPVLILAGAGSGKTRVLTYRMAHMIEELNIFPYKILAITFTNKAAREMQERVEKIIGERAKDMWISTFHSTCVRILRREIEKLGYKKNFTIYDSTDQKTLIKECIKLLQINDKEITEQEIIGKISRAKDNMQSADAYYRQHESNFREKKIAEVYKMYQKRLKENNALDFDDLIFKTVELFKKNPETLEFYQRKFQYIMVDEYQDTNGAQYELVTLLAAKYRNICVVGDDDQCIYQWRGADIKNILGFEKDYPEAKVIKLEQNYRSKANILNAANGVIANNVGRKAKRLWTENEEGEKIAFHQFETGFDEADYVAKDIRSKVREGMYHYGDCAVLYRTNAQSRLFEERFITASIPYKIVGGVNFYSRREIKDLLAYLKTIDNAMDDLAVRRIINVPKRGIGATTLSRVQDYADENGLTFYNALKMAEEIGTIGRASAKIRPFVMLIQSMRSKLPYISVSELLQEIIEETGYVRELEAENTEEAQQRIENIDELISKAVTYEESEEEPTLSGFLEEVALVADIDSVDETQDYVVLMTLHSAKGLEFPQVYLAGMEDGLFPGFGAICAENPTAEIEEERRLAYVGITRAKERLSISCARMRMIRGETQYNKVSRFVKEIPRELLAGTIQKEKMPDIPKPSMMAKNAFSAKPMALRRTGVPEARNFGNSAMKKPLDYAVGDTVSHLKFGTGVVKQIIDGGRDYEVTVDFSGVGVKKMFASFAKLKKL